MGSRLHDFEFPAVINFDVSSSVISVKEARGATLGSSFSVVSFLDIFFRKSRTNIFYFLLEKQ